MALNTNYGYPPSGYSSPYSSPYSSTPTGIRAQRPRFGYSGPSNYSRSFSSAGANAESFSEYDSMNNNYGTSTSRIDTSFNSENRSSYDDSYNTSGSTYYSANNTFSHGESYGETSMMHNNLRNKEGITRNNSMMYENKNIMPDYSGNKALPQNNSSVYMSKPVSYFDTAKHNFAVHMNEFNAGEFKGNFKKPKTDSDYKLFKLGTLYPSKNSTFGDKKPYFFPRKLTKPKKMASTKQSVWRCEICSLDFTSQIPHDMHLRGAKHAKKIKAKEALKAVKLQADKTITSPDDKNKTFFCELCNVNANSSLQLQTHLEGSKHKNKLQPKEASSESQTQETSKESGNVSVNGKTNGSLVRTLPADFEEPRPSKLAKFACEVCNISVNSDVQLQQHLSSKKHQNKVEGKPVNKGKKIRKDSDAASVTDTAVVTDTVVATDAALVTDAAEKISVEQASNETSTKVVGVKTLSSSFVQGETLH